MTLRKEVWLMLMINDCTRGRSFCPDHRPWSWYVICSLVLSQKALSKIGLKRVYITDWVSENWKVKIQSKNASSLLLK